jgi:hypothetical protein
MSDIGQTIFGGSKSKQESKSLAYPMIKDQFQGQIGQGGQANSLLASLLGMGDPAAGGAAFDTFKNSTGYNQLLDSGSRAITGNRAAKGLLNSGSTGKALTTFGQSSMGSYLKDFMSSLSSLSDTGLKAGGLVTDAGRVQKGTSSDKPGLGGTFAKIATGMGG